MERLLTCSNSGKCQCCSDRISVQADGSSNYLNGIDYVSLGTRLQQHSRGNKSRRKSFSIFSKLFTSFSMYGGVGIYDEPERALPLEFFKSTLSSFCTTHPDPPVQNILIWQITCSIVSNQSSSSIMPTTHNRLELKYGVTLCSSRGFINCTWTHKPTLECPCP